MNDRTTRNTTDFEGEPLPPDLAALARDLDAIGVLDSAAAPTGIEDRLWAASRSHIVGTPSDVLPVAAGLESLATDERAMASAELEPRAFELSREAIAGGLPRAATPALRVVGTQVAPFPVVVVDRFRFVRRLSALAAAIALVGATVGIYLSTRPSPSPASPTDALAERLDRELSSLFEAVELSKGENGTANRRDGEHELDQAWLDEIYTEESL